MRSIHRFKAGPRFIEKLALWANQYDFGFCFRGKGWGAHFDGTFDAMAGAGVASNFSGALSDAASFVNATDDFVIAHLSYDLKNELEDLSSVHPDQIAFARFGLTVPLWVIRVSNGEAEVHAHPSVETSSTEIKDAIEAMDPHQAAGTVHAQEPNMRMSRANYLESLGRIQAHIQQGDIYQANLCQEFSWRTDALQPAVLFNKGFEATPNPFSVFYKYQGKHCLSLSPERYLCFYDRTVMSQPMKGTSPRGATPEEDHMHYEWLLHSEKDRRENVMIVDMVRNDLSHYAEPGSVKVPELYRIEAYPKVHQMYSTVTAQLRSEATLMDVLLKAFPMGSMTGAPKVQAMKRIEQYEQSKRGLFSGSIGFITPEKNADFNVVIRSLMYAAEHNILSCHVGGGITALSEPEAEYEECMVKFEPVKQLVRTACALGRSEPQLRPTFAP